MANVSPKTQKALAFNAVARRIAGLNDIGPICEQLRLIWNARGAADIATVESELFEIMKPADVGRHLKRLDRAIRALDRTGRRPVDWACRSDVVSRVAAPYERAYIKADWSGTPFAHMIRMTDSPQTPNVGVIRESESRPKLLDQVRAHDTNAAL
jgi:hypothetical protein